MSVAWYQSLPEGEFPSRWHVSGGEILDELNSPLGLLRGFNVHVHPGTTTASGEVWGQTHYDAMAALGVKIVRCTLHWDSLQPTSETNVNAGMIADIDTAVTRAGNAGIYSVFEIHFNVGRVPGWASGFGWETDAFMGHGQFVTEYLATRYANDKRVVGLSWNEIPIVPTADLLTFHEACVPWYRDIATEWPLWIVPTAYGQGTPYPDNNLDADMTSYLALDTNTIGLIAEYHHYFVESGTGSDNGYQFNGAIDRVVDVGPSGSNYGGVYPDTAGALADLGRHVQPWKDWQDTGSGRVVTAVGEWAYLYDGAMTGYGADHYAEYVADLIGTFRDRDFAIEMWWNYDTANNPGVNPYAARPDDTWRPSVQEWFDVPV